MKGLTTPQADRARKKFGSNALSEQTRESFFQKFLGNFNDPVIKILCVALALNMLFALLGQTEWYEAAGIAVAVIVATLVSTFFEYRNESAFQKLQEDASKITVKVYRDGSISELNIDDVVVGDYVLLQSGDKIPADGFVVEGFLIIDQSVLNGEAKEARKTAVGKEHRPSGDQVDFLDSSSLFRGSIVCSGHAVMQVEKVGSFTVYGSIADELGVSNERETPLKVKLSHLARNISRFGYIGGLAIAIAFLFRSIVISNGFDMATIVAYCSNWMVVANDIVKAVMLAVIIIVMAVPEGLPLMIALVSSMNMGKMLKDNVLVRDISGIETAGSLNILFCDKTGTITKGQLEVVSFFDGEKKEYSAFSQISDCVKAHLVLNCRANSEAEMSEGGEGKKIIGGNATERALLGYVSDAIYEQCNVSSSILFDSSKKYSAAQLEGEDRVLIKGAPEIILSRCASSLAEDGRSVAFDFDGINAIIDDLASRSIRVLAFAECRGIIVDGQIVGDEWQFIGISGIRDDIRSESFDAIAETQAAGIQVVMITGDRKETAASIAKETGLLRDDSSLVLTSSELSKLSDDDIAKLLPNIRVVARALPADKSRLVKIAQGLNLVVGMTGDGVNDSPALKRADVGFAMGGGTEVAKEAAEIIILDDNFLSIEKAVLYGRTIFNSIRKFIIFQLTINISAVLVSFVLPLIGLDSPLTVVQILWVNLIMDTLAALAFGGEPALRRYMNEKPKRRDEPIVNAYMKSQIVVDGMWIFALSLVFLLFDPIKMAFRVSVTNDYLFTGFFAFFVFSSVFNAFNARTESLNLFGHMRENRGFLKIMLLIVAVQIALVYLGGDVFRCYGLNVQEWAVVLLLAITVIPVDLLRKVLMRRKEK